MSNKWEDKTANVGPLGQKLGQTTPQVVGCKSANIGGDEAIIVLFDDGAKLYADNKDTATLVLSTGVTKSFYGFDPDDPYDVAQDAAFRNGQVQISPMDEAEKREWANILHGDDPLWMEENGLANIAPSTQV